jgi:hypothetical protein
MRRDREAVSTVIASEAKQSSFGAAQKAGLLRRFAPRNDGLGKCPLFGIPVGVRADTFVMPGLDPGIHPSSQEVLSKKMDCRIKPGNDVLSAFARQGPRFRAGEPALR